MVGKVISLLCLVTAVLLKLFVTFYTIQDLQNIVSQWFVLISIQHVTFIIASVVKIQLVYNL